MTEIRCGQCAACFDIPDGYVAPYLKCPGCGSHQKNPAIATSEPVYRILDHAGRQRAAQPGSVENEELPPEDAQSERVKTGPRVVAPAIASTEKKQSVAVNRIDHKVSGRPVGEKKILEDSLGKNGMEMVYQLVAGYLDELSENRRRIEKTKAMQTLMRAKFPAELAARAVEFAEKSPEIQEILWGNYRAALKRGVFIFAAGVIISLVVHFLARPGRELVFFQLPFAVGLAYSLNAGLNMAGLKFVALRSNSVHYGFLFFASLLILGYIVWGVFF